MMHKVKLHQQPAYLLHARPYSESSLLIDLFSRRHGRLTVIAKGARRPKSRTRGLLLPFIPLLASWSGKNLPILTALEQSGRAAQVRGAALVSGYYLNELLLRLLHRHDSHAPLFDCYHRAIVQLGAAQSTRRVLRVFEKNLLQHIGFGLLFDRDSETGEPIIAARRYHYVPERGPMHNPPSEYAVPISGRALCALRDERFESDAQLVEAQLLTRALIDRQLNGRGLRSRRVLVEMNRCALRWRGDG